VVQVTEGSRKKQLKKRAERLSKRYGTEIRAVAKVRGRRKERNRVEMKRRRRCEKELDKGCT
jgi:hypothetical protein